MVKRLQPAWDKDFSRIDWCFYATRELMLHAVMQAGTMFHATHAEMLACKGFAGNIQYFS
jgi:hypothetical protein